MSEPYRSLSLYPGCFSRLGCGDQEDSPPLVRIPLNAVETTIAGGTRAQRVLLRDVIAGLGRTRIQLARFEAPRIELYPFRQGELVLRLEHGAFDDALSAWQMSLPDDSRTLWEMRLVASVVDARLSAQGLGSIFWLEGDAGGTRLGPASRHALRPSRADRRDAEVLAAAVERAAARAGARIEEFGILQPYGLAPALTLRVDDPARFLKKKLVTFFGALRRAGSYEGWLVQVLDPEGRLVFVYAWTRRAGGFAPWARRDLEGCLPVHSSRPRGYVIPPCPA